MYLFKLYRKLSGSHISAGGVEMLSVGISFALEVSVLETGAELYTQPITELDEPVTVKLEVPENILVTDPDRVRVYTVVRLHNYGDGNGLTAEAVQMGRVDDDNCLTFETKYFSTYSIVYVEMSKTEYCEIAGHEWGDWVTVTEPTATAEGVKMHRCSYCGAEETETIPATGTTDDGNGGGNTGSGTEGAAQGTVQTTTDAALPADNEQTIKISPATGDERNNPFGWFLLAAVSGIGAVFTSFFGRKKKE